VSGRSGSVAVRQRLTSEHRRPITAPCGSLTHLVPLGCCAMRLRGTGGERAQPASPCTTAPEPMVGTLWTSYDASFPAIWVEAMKRRSRAGGEPAKTRRRKRVTLEHRKTPKAARRRTATAGGLETEVARLTHELNEAREQQRATAEVLSAISRSNFELQPILQSVVDTASQLCRADASVIFRLEGGVYRFAAGYSLDPAYLEHERRTPISPGPGTIVGRAAMSREVVQIEDAWTDPLYEQKAAVKISGGRSMIGVPLMREGEPIGVMGLARTRVDPFAQREIDLVTTFADQAVIAIENARLFEAEQQRTRELARSLEDLRTAQDRLVQTEKLASLGQLTAGIAHEIKNPLNFVNNFSAVSVELIDELREALGSAHLDSKLRAEIAGIADMLEGNLDKVVQHGERADAIVKNMLLHSRQGSGEHRPVDINALVEESLNLAYHGARAEKQGFNITLERSFDPAAGEVDLFPQEITRVLLNLISNGFYAATKRKAEANGGDYEPTLAAATKNLGDRVEIRIRDNGTGIPPEVKEKLFNPFFTTKPAGEGTGLGLSISHDIIVKQHGGSIEVDTQPGEFTEFRIVLPRAGASLIKSGERM
jgi:two-component system, NtrC family, sensor kinase